MSFIDEGHSKGPEIREKLAFGHPLDEVDGKELTPEERFVGRRQEALRIAEQGKFGIGQVVYVRELPWLGPDHHVAVAMGAEESEVEGLRLTQHAFVWRPASLTELKGLNQEERRLKLIEKICRANYFTIGLNGWASNQGMWEAIEAIILNVGRGEKLDRTVAQIVGMPGFEDVRKEHLSLLASELQKLPEETMAIDLSIMGGLGGLDLDHASSLNKEGVVVQVFEALDKIGREVCEFKLQEIESPAWQQKKKAIIQEIFGELITAGYNGRELPNFDSPEWRDKIWQLQEMLETEELLAKGIYFDVKIGLVKGHSMGGNIVSEMMSHVLMNKKMSDLYLAYRSRHDDELHDFVETSKKRVIQASANLFAYDASFDFSFFGDDDRVMKYLVGRKLQITDHEKLLDEFKRVISEEMALISADELSLNSVGRKYANMTFQSWMQLVFGDQAEDLPVWGEKIKKLAEGQNIGFHVLLQRDPLLNLVMEFAKFSPALAKGELELGDLVGLVEGLLTKYVGEGLPEDLNPLYKLSLKEALQFVLVCNRILTDMSAPWDDEIMNSITQQHLAKWTMFVGDDDKTLMSYLIEAMAEEMVSMSEEMPATASIEKKPIIRKFYNTGHHPKTNDVEAIAADQWGKLLHIDALSLDGSKKILDKLMALLNKNVLAKNVFS